MSSSEERSPAPPSAPPTSAQPFDGSALRLTRPAIPKPADGAAARGVPAPSSPQAVPRQFGTAPRERSPQARPTPAPASGTGAPSTGRAPESAGEGLPQAGITSFVEPGRQHLSAFNGAHSQEALPAHLDSRIAGLDSAPGKSRWFGRRAKIDVVSNNPTSDALHARIRQPRRISVVGLKGGVGKTTASILISATAARERREPVLLFDGDTTYGSLVLRTGVVPVASAHDIARMGDPGRRDLFGSVIPRTRDDVWVLPSGRSPEQSANFGPQTYVEAMRAVYRHFSITVTDCGAGMAGPLMNRVLTATHALVIAAAPSFDGLLASHNALEWLASLGMRNLLERTVIVLGNIPEDGGGIDIEDARSRFAGKCRGVVAIPSDPHLRSGGLIDYDQLADDTRRAARDLTGLTIEASLSVP